MANKSIESLVAKNAENRLVIPHGPIKVAPAPIRGEQLQCDVFAYSFSWGSRICSFLAGTPIHSKLPYLQIGFFFLVTR